MIAVYFRSLRIVYLSYFIYFDQGWRSCPGAYCTLLLYVWVLWLFEHPNGDVRIQGFQYMQEMHMGWVAILKLDI